MRSQGGVTLLRLLLILAALCCTGFGLTCYECPSHNRNCTVSVVCAPDINACLYAVAGQREYRQCWRYADCSSQTIMTRLQENQVLYRCCQKDLCNTGLQERDGAAALSGKTVLLVTTFLAAVWNLCF
ncbi:CD59 glycoprotein [Fukomys damarensis]|nr:CD59 glycoprotein [Fukomys damarensis]XP_010610924.1 CD59 glycoprotein [Fukomys damarensis]